MYFGMQLAYIKTMKITEKAAFILNFKTNRTNHIYNFKRDICISVNAAYRI